MPGVVNIAQPSAGNGSAAGYRPDPAARKWRLSSVRPLEAGTVLGQFVADP